MPGIPTTSGPGRRLRIGTGDRSEDTPRPRPRRHVQGTVPWTRPCSGAARGRPLRGLELVREVGQHLGAVVGDEDEALEPDAAVALPVEAGLDREHVARHERLAVPADVRFLVHLEADAVAGRVVEAVL